MQMLVSPRPPAPPRRRASTYRWYGCDLVTGAVLEELPVTPGGPLKRTLGRYETLDLALPIPDVSPKKDWIGATDPLKTMLVCERREDRRIVWGCMVVARDRGSSPTASLAGVTVEGYLDRRWVNDHVFSDVDQGAIATAILADIAPDGIGYDVVSPNTGVLRDRQYFADQVHTAYYELQQLMSLLDGPEWTVELEWGDDSHTWVRKRVRVGSRIGVATSEPAAVFDYPGSIASYVLREDRSSDKFANQTMALSDGEGASQPKSSRYTDQASLDAGHPLVQYAETYSGVTQSTTLNAYAQADLRVMKTGANVLTLSAIEKSAPQVISDWDVGHDIGIHVKKSHGHPAGFTAVGRALGWELEVTGEGPAKVTPIMWSEDA
jgi:hypothetical protein